MKGAWQFILAVLALVLRVMLKEFVSLMQHGQVLFQHAYISTYYRGVGRGFPGVSGNSLNFWTHY